MRGVVPAGVLIAFLSSGCGPPQAPAFELKNLKGEVVSSGTLRGHVAVVYFWASWSPPSRLGLVPLNKVARSAAAQGVTVLAVAVSDDPVQVARSLKGTGVSSVSVLLGDDGIVENYFPGRGGDLTLPLTLVLDARGRIARRLSGYQAGDDLAAVIDQVVAGKRHDSGTVTTE
jgi:peroxiredoxin